jgi:hypothetical protein
MNDTCISCGMPMRTADDHAGKLLSNAFCHHCARPDASMKSYDEVLDGMIGFLKRTQGVDDAVARETARGMLATRPAWRDRS